MNRNTMDKLYPAQVEERTAFLQTPTSAAILDEFEEFGQQLEKDQAREKPPTRAPRGFVWGVLTTLGVVFVSISVMFSTKFAAHSFALTLKGRHNIGYFVKPACTSRLTLFESRYTFNNHLVKDLAYFNSCVFNKKIVKKYSDFSYS